jgi:hypothetical protein
VKTLEELKQEMEDARAVAAWVLLGILLGMLMMLLGVLMMLLGSPTIGN